MAIYSVEGTLGSGKSLQIVRRIRDAIREGRKVATNFDLWMEHLTEGKGATHVIRLPDHPTLADFRALGHGMPESTQWKNGRRVRDASGKMNGLIVLDEISSILDNRSWQGKERQDLIDWLKHTRKLQWDLYLIAQSAKMLDTLVRDALLEQRVICVRLDKVPIPLFGWLFKLVAFSGRFGRVHLATVIFKGLTVERWWIWPWQMQALYRAYDTLQVFHPTANPGLIEMQTIVKGEKKDTVLLPQGARQYLDLYRAPWLRDPRSTWRHRLADWCASKGFLRGLEGMIRPAVEAGPWVDIHLMPEVGVGYHYKPASGPSFAEWLSARPDTGPEVVAKTGARGLEIEAICEEVSREPLGEGEAAQPQLVPQAA